MNLGKTIIADFDHALYFALTSSTSIVKEATTEIQKLAAEANAALPEITADLNNPIIKAVAAYLPGGTAILSGVTTILNKFQPAIAAAANPSVMTALQNEAIAEITSLIHGAKKTIGEYLCDFVKMIGL